MTYKIGDANGQRDATPAEAVELATFFQQADAARVAQQAADALDAVWAEKDRRLALGFDYNFGDARGIHRIGTTPTDMVGWDEVGKVAQALLNVGQTSYPITIMTNTGTAEVTPVEWQQIILAAAAFRQPIWAASFVLASMDPIPADYATNEAYWSSP